MKNVRQVTLVGRRAGEAYYSMDGEEIVFQSEREPQNPFYQIYRMNLKSGAVVRVSPGFGKTTCPWFHPNGKKVLFASTHEDPEARKKMADERAFRASGKSRSYAGDYDENYEIYEVDTQTKALKRLTHAAGYDAEGSWSSDGEWVVFASNRRAYDGSMSKEEETRFAADPSYMIDLYRMRADGRELQRLTDHPGYDGRPFFSPDNQRITWRRFDESGQRAEIWTMKADGTDKKKLTSLGTMSWAPFYSPDGRYIIFTTNLHGFGHFELYIVDAEGQRAPVRVTYADGFDGFPVFSPDGQTLLWTSTRTPNKQGQVFAADWNHTAASLALGLPTVASSPFKGTSEASRNEATVLAGARLRAHVEALTSEAMAGRETGTQGEKLATRYVSDIFEELGLEPWGTEGWFEPFEFTSGVRLGAGNALLLRSSSSTQTVSLAVETDWRPLAFSSTGTVASSGLAFAGYGVVAPEIDGQPGYDAYGSVDVRDRWVVVFRYLPENISPERRQHLVRYSSLRYKAMEARDRGAKGLIVVSGPRAQVQDELVSLRFDAALSGAGLAAISISNNLGAQLLGGPSALEELQNTLDSGKPRDGFVIDTMALEAKVALVFEKAYGRNVIGRLKVNDEREAQRPAIVIGAHIDHLGLGNDGDSLARSDERGQIHPGADDNASGVAGLIEIARTLSRKKKQGQLIGAQRDLVFAAWSGEEMGLYGSTHFVERLSLAKKSALSDEVIAYLNMDMIGRLRGHAVVQGVGSSMEWPGLLEQVNVRVQAPIQLNSDTYLPTDATPFYLAGVPILAFFTGAHADYHTPRDKADRLNYEGIAQLSNLLTEMSIELSSRTSSISYQRVAPPKKSGSRRLGRAYVGTIPDYVNSSEGGAEGVLLSGVSADGPAEKAGVRGGDVLVGLSGQKISNIYDFVRILDGLKIGQKTTIAVMREGRRYEFELTPGSRD